MDNLRHMIGLDLDGVIIDHTPIKIAVARTFGFELKPRQTHSELISTIIDQPTLELIKTAIYDDPAIARSQPLVAGATHGIAAIQNSGIPYAIISRRRAGRENAVQLLKTHNLWPRYFSEKNVFFVDTIAGKDEVAKSLGITHFVDDELKILKAMPSVLHTFLFDQFKNFKHIEPHTAVSTWEELSAHLL